MQLVRLLLARLAVNLAGHLLQAAEWLRDY